MLVEAVRIEEAWPDFFLLPGGFAAQPETGKLDSGGWPCTKHVCVQRKLWELEKQQQASLSFGQHEFVGSKVCIDAQAH